MKIKIYRHCLSGNYIRQTFGDHHLQGYCRYSCVPGIVQKKGPSEDQRSPIPAQTTVLVSGFKIWEFRVWCNRGLIQSKDSKVCSFVAKYWVFWARTIRSSVSNIAFGALVHQGGGGVWLKPGLFGSWMCVCWQDSTRQLPNRPHMVFQCVWTPGIK